MSSIGFVLPALETMSVVSYGWRDSAVLFGLVCGGLVVLSSLFLLSCPEDHGLLQSVDEEGPFCGASPRDQAQAEFEDLSQTIEVSLREALRLPVFWAVVLCWSVMCIPWSGINFLLASILKQQGFGQQDAVYVYLMLSIFSAITALFCGFLVDFIPKDRRQRAVAIVNGCMLFALLAGAFLVQIPWHIGPALLGIFLGCWEGCGNVVSTVIIPDLFGKKAAGSIRAVFMASAQVSSGIGPLVTAIVMDVGISFQYLCLMLAILQGIGILAIFGVTSPQANATKVRKKKKAKTAASTASQPLLAE